VPFATALRIAEKLESKDVVVSLIKDADHRLSRDEDIGRLCQMVAELTGRVSDFMERSAAAAPDARRDSRESAGGRRAPS
jgi:hypothetical protein